MERRVTMAQAARMLGVSKEAIRKRVDRGTIDTEMGDDGLRYVWLDAGEVGAHADAHDHKAREELITVLKEQLEAERNAHAETRRILYTLAQQMPALEPSQTGEDAPNNPTEPPTDTEQWRKFFGVE